MDILIFDTSPEVGVECQWRFLERITTTPRITKAPITPPMTPPMVPEDWASSGRGAERKQRNSREDVMEICPVLSMFSTFSYK